VTATFHICWMDIWARAYCIDRTIMSIPPLLLKFWATVTLIYQNIFLIKLPIILETSSVSICIFSKMGVLSYNFIHRYWTSYTFKVPQISFIGIFIVETIRDAAVIYNICSVHNSNS
jgi:hypothetical protein